MCVCVIIVLLIDAIQGEPKHLSDLKVDKNVYLLLQPIKSNVSL